MSRDRGSGFCRVGERDPIRCAGMTTSQRLLAAFWIAAGVNHFANPKIYQAIMPDYLPAHRELVLNWFRAKNEFSAGVVEGLNNKANLSTRMAYGFRSYETLEIVLYHRLGDLPEPEFAHKFF